MNLADLFDLTLKGSPGATALEYGGQEWTFGALETNSNRLAHHLKTIGFETGDRLAVYLTNCVELIEAYLAAIKLGLIFTPINALYREWEIGHILSDAEPKAILTSRSLLAALPSVQGVLLVEELASRRQDQSSERPSCPATGDTIAALVYTSGTTGRPKGAALTHNNLAINALTLNTCWQLAASDRMLLALPLFHINGLANCLHTWLTLGFRVRLLERFRKETILDDFMDFRPTFFFGVPTMYIRLLDASAEVARRIGEPMRLFVSGSAPLASDTLERFRQLYGHTILERYGMTETLGIMANPYSGERRPGTVGKPLPGLSIRLSKGEQGEVLVKGPTVFAGYWRDREATKAVFTADGYLQTGDIAERAMDGYYTLRGRRSDLIISGGFNVYPQEIENLLKKQAGVLEAVVVGEPDAIRGERPVAYLVTDSNARLDAEALRTACQANLASYKTPRDFRFVKDLPRNALGKIQRHRLRPIDGAQ
jgi:malonyl-CoA/methylmalonyl-CoA synthetase